MGYKIIFLEKILNEVIDQRLKEKVKDIFEIMNHLTSMKIVWDGLLSFHMSMFSIQRFLDGVLIHFAER